MASEYLGTLVVASAVVAALATTHVGQAISGEASRVVCQIAAADCPAQAAETPPGDGLTDEQRRARDLGPSELGEPAPGTPEERIHTRTPPPPGGDQCSSSPDTFQVPGVGRLYDFSYACYGHDLCWQNGTYGGVPRDLFECNRIFLASMRDHCDRRHTGFGSGLLENRCFEIAEVYFAAVQAAALAKLIDE